MSRSSSLLDIRPALPQAAVQADTLPAEAFQNSVLRPILKLQHPLLMRIMAHYLRQKKLDIATLSTVRQHELIAHLLHTDQRLIHLVTGLVVGLMTEDEYATFLLYEKELLKRIRSLSIQRLQSDLPGLMS